MTNGLRRLESQRHATPCRSSKPPRGRARLHVEFLEDRSVPTLLGQSLFPADNPWNQKITSAPVTANSAAIMNSIVSTYGDGRLHPDFSQDDNSSNDLYGIPYNVVHGNSVAKSQVVIDWYPGESDVAPAPIPLNAVIEGDFRNGPKAGLDNRGDSHLLVFDVDNDIAYEFYAASRPSENADGKWHAGQETVWDMKTNQFRTLGWTSADAAGLSILAGLARPDEGLPVSQGGQGVINHAIRLTLQNAVVLNQFIYPASHVANAGNTNVAIQPPMGARFRLKANVDLSQLNPQARIIAQAMRDYGMIVADNGSNFYFSGASASMNASNQEWLTWNDNDIQDSVHGLKSLHFSNFEVVDLTPIVSDLSVHAGPAGTSVTIVGQNFSGSAGRVQVFFGNTAAASVTVVDDFHIVATAPSGTGTVDVRVQSGVASNNTSNINNPVFGYGTSAVSAGDRFTFGTPPPNQPPTVATAAAASAVSNSNKSNLSVLGADDGGETNLSYTWSSTGPATVTFSSNGTNAGKNTTATFTQAGAYSLTVTIADAQGLNATSNVVLTVASVSTLKNVDIVFGADGAWRSIDGVTGATRVLAQWSPQSAANWKFANTGDFNNDGRTDLVAFANGQWWVGLQTATGFTTSLWTTWSNAVTWTDVTVADVTGDGKADILGRCLEVGSWWVAVANGVNGFTNQMFAAWSAAAGWHDTQVGDLNGDNRADIIARTSDGSWWMGLSTGSSFTTSYALSWNESAGWRDVRLGDVNGDGRMDLVGRTSFGDWWVSLSTAAGFTTSRWAGWMESAGWQNVLFGDFNADGRIDIAGRSSGQWWISLSTGSTFTTSLWGSFSPAAGWSDMNVGDFDGDGRADIIGHTGVSWWIGASTGTALQNRFLGNFTFTPILAKYGRIEAVLG